MILKAVTVPKIDYSPSTPSVHRHYPASTWRRGSESGAARHIFCNLGKILLRIQANSIISNCIEKKPFCIRFGIRSSG